MLNQTKCKTFSMMPACSNHGVCDETVGKCICDNGWTSIGDYSIQPGVHCGINKMAIKVLSLIVILSSLFMLYFSIKLCLKREKRVTKSKWSYFTDPHLIARVSFTLIAILAIIFSILKIINQEKFAIGLDPVSSLIFYFQSICIALALCAYTLILIKFVLGYSKIMTPTSRESITIQSERIKRIVYFLMLSSPISASTPIINLFDQSLGQTSLRALLIILIFLASFILFSVYRYLGVIANEIGNLLEINTELLNHGKDGNGKDLYVQLKRKFDGARIATIVIVFFGSLITWSFLFVDVLTYNTAYIMPINGFMAIVLFTYFVKSLVNQTKGPRLSNNKQSKDNQADEKNIAAASPQNIVVNNASKVSKLASDDKNSSHVVNPA